MRKILYNLIPLCIAVMALISCNSSLKSKSLAELDFFNNLSFEAPHFKEVTLNLKQGQKLEFWSSIDIQYEGEIEMSYLIEVWEKNQKNGGFELNALKTNPTFFSTKKQLGNKSTWSFQGKMDFLKIDHDGNYTFKVILYCSDPNIHCKTAKLIFK